MIRTPLRPLARILSARQAGQDPDEIEAELRAQREGGEEEHAEGELRVDADVSAFVPSSYVPYEAAKIDGASHASFGDYGAQPGDGTTALSDPEMNAAVNTAVAELLAARR